MVAPIPNRFAGKVVAITGGASGIGAAMAARYVAEGARVLIADICAVETGEAFATQLNSTMTEAATQPDRSKAAAVFHQCDLLIPEQAAGVVTATVEVFGTIDILHNNAGSVIISTVPNMHPDKWHKMYKLHVDAPFYASRAAVQHMLTKPATDNNNKNKSRGVIINTVSTAGVRAESGMAAYSSSKAALVSLTQVMAVDHAMDGIRVNAVAPGYTKTPLATILPNVLDVLSNQLPMHRAAEVEEVASVMMFLASEEASYVTGAGKWFLYALKCAKGPSHIIQKLTPFLNSLECRRWSARTWHFKHWRA